MPIKDTEFASLEYSDMGQIYGVVRSAPEISSRNMDYISGGSPAIFQPNQYMAAFTPKSSILGQDIKLRIIPDALVNRIQSQATDDYFDQASKLSMVITEYTHTGDRQKKRNKHIGAALDANTSWDQGARDGTWELTSITSYDSNGAKNVLTRDFIDPDNDITISDGTAVLN